MIKILDTNWKTGKYEMKFESGNPDLNDGFKYDDDYILSFPNHTQNLWRDRQFEIINRRAMRTEGVNHFNWTNLLCQITSYKSQAFNILNETHLADGYSPSLRDVSDFQIHANIIMVASNNAITYRVYTVLYCII